jgi:alpha-ketoglutarate-dependent taurine dioxygenase
MESDLTAPLKTSTIGLGKVGGQTQAQGLPFHLVLSPTSPLTMVELQEYFTTHHAAILKAASNYGAVMFRGFDRVSPEDFASILHKSGLKEVPYIGGAAVRKLVVGSEKSPIKRVQVVTTNESPPSEPIPFHHELAQTPYPPSHICFYCQVAPEEGGSTPLIRSDLVLNPLHTSSHIQTT